jgi:DNA modification methylase
MSIKILKGNCLETLSSLKEKSVNTCVTSPPYWGLRDYGTGEWIGGDPNCTHKGKSKIGNNCITGHKEMYGQDNAVGNSIYKSECPDCGAVRKDEQLGLEETPEKFVENLVKLFREVKRVLRDDGTVWLNLGDTYYNYRSDGKYPKQTVSKTKQDLPEFSTARGNKLDGLKSKDLIGIPWRVAFALQADGWYLRQDIIWNKPNPMPESVKDRCTKSHEYIFLLSKSKNYYFDNEAIKENSTESSKNRLRQNIEDQKGSSRVPYKTNGNMNAVGGETRNKRSVWTVTTKPYSEAHFATYPHDLIIPCILAGCPEGGTVLDPFGGSGTTAQVASNLNRNAILCELNPDYVDIAEKRLNENLGMFMDLTVDTPLRKEKQNG